MYAYLIIKESLIYREYLLSNILKTNFNTYKTSELWDFLEKRKQV